MYGIWCIKKDIKYAKKEWRVCMNIFNILNLIGGLSLFLFGMTLMGQALALEGLSLPL